MDSSLSPIVADLVMQKLESFDVVRGFCTFLLYFFISMSTIYAWRFQCLKWIFSARSIRFILVCITQFTMEVEHNLLNFLDISIIINNNHLIFDWYHKLKQIFKFFFNHLTSQKKGIIFNLMDRVFLMSDLIFHAKNISLVINFENNFPLKFIFDTINNRIKDKSSFGKSCLESTT